MPSLCCAPLASRRLASGGSDAWSAKSCGSLLLDWNPRIVTVSQARAKAFVREHHAHCPPPAGWRFGAGLCNGHELIGVVMVGRPVARRLDPARVVEVNRLCIRRDLPHGLTWNACSMLYAWSAREAKARGYDRIVTYTLDSEPGTTLRAAGWDSRRRLARRLMVPRTATPHGSAPDRRQGAVVATVGRAPTHALSIGARP